MEQKPDLLWWAMMLWPHILFLVAMIVMELLYH